MIDIILPHNEICSNSKKGPVASVVINNNYYQNELLNERVFGSNQKRDVELENYYQLKSGFLSFLGKGWSYIYKLKKLHFKIGVPKIIEIHNRPIYLKYFGKKYENTKFVLYLHNDPRNMRSLKTKDQRENLLKKIDAIITVSNYIKSCYLSGLKIDENSNKITTIHNGIDRWLNKFPQKEKTIVFSGRLNDDKGIIELLNSLNFVLPRYPDWKAIIFGRPDRNISLNIQEIAKKNKNLLFLGEKPNYEVKNLLEKCSICCVPSKWQEPLSLSVIEGLAAGCAVVTSNRGGIPEIAKDKALLLDDVSENSISSALIKLIEDNNFRVFLQKKAWKNYSLSSKFSSQKLNLVRRNLILG